MSTVEARLSKRYRRRIVCGAVECGTELAQVDLLGGYNLIDRLGARPTMAHPDDRSAGYVSFSPGWVQDDNDRWVLTRRAMDRLLHQRPPKYRKSIPRTGRQVRRTTTLPAVVVCPACGRANSVTDEGLGITEWAATWRRDRTRYLAYRAPWRLREE